MAVAAVLAAGTGRAAEPPLKLQTCRLSGYPTELQCGTLSRPLDPAAPGGKRIDLRVVVLPALARNKLPDPVVFLAGGPGQSAVRLLPTVASYFSRLSNRRDIVFVDQRGTGKSAPLVCDEMPAQPLAQAMDLQAMIQRTVDCGKQLQKLPHGDLRQYTTPIAMQDLDAVRQALGVVQWNVVGGSYGTRAALEYQRQFPQAVRRSIIDGVAPPDMALPKSFSTDNQAALDALMAACAAEPGCQKAFPDLAQTWAQLMASLPKAVTVRDPLTQRDTTVTIQPAHVVRAVRGPLYAPSLSAVLPAAITQAAQGRWEPLAALSGSVGRGMRLADGMHFSVVCAEDLPRMSANAGTAADVPGKDYAAHDAQLYGAICKDWPRGQVPEAFYTVPKAQSAVLVLSGGADPVTPPRHGQRVAAALGALAKHQVVPAAGHGVMSLPCMRDVLARFVDAKTDAEALAVDTTCAVSMPRALAYVPPNPQLPPVKKNQEDDQ